MFSVRAASAVVSKRFLYGRVDPFIVSAFVSSKLDPFYVFWVVHHWVGKFFFPLAVSQPLYKQKKTPEPGTDRPIQIDS